MAHALRERTVQVLTDYLQHCAREPGAPSCNPSTPAAAVLRRAADELKWSNWSFFVSCRDFRGNRAELLQQVAQEMLADGRGLTWHRVVALVTFAGTLVDRLPPETHGVGVRRRTREEVDRDCQCLVDVLCNVLVDQNGAWLEAHGGWDGFCLFFAPHLVPSFWKILLFVILCIVTTIIYYRTQRQ